MAKRKSLLSIRHTKPENLGRADTLRELIVWRKKLGLRGMARKSGVPASTLRGWFRARRIPDKPKSLAHARLALENLRKPPPDEDQAAQREIVHWAFAAGPDVTGVSLPRLELVVQPVIAGSNVGSVAALDVLARVHVRVADLARSGATVDPAVAGYEYQHADNHTITHDGHQFLSDAWIAALIWLLDALQIPHPVLDYVPEDVASSRPNATTYTNDAMNIWSLFNYLQQLPVGPFIVHYEPRDDMPWIYILSVWELDHS